MMRKVISRVFVALSFLTMIIITYACFYPLEQTYGFLIEEALSKNTLIHISISDPKGWKLGADKTFQVLSDFPFTIEPTLVDYVAFRHPSSKSNMFISYKPILGTSYFNSIPEKVAEWFKEALVVIYDEREIERASEAKLETNTVGGRTFFVIKTEIFTDMKEKRTIFIYLHISDDLKSLYTFCFSTPAKKGIEESQLFQDFIAIVRGFKTIKLNPYDEILYRNYAKLWLRMESDIEAKLSKAIIDESIEELRNAVALRPAAWEPHYLLAEEYGSRYFLGYKYEMLSVRGAEPQAVRGPSYSSFPVNADAAIEEYKYLLGLDPNFNDASKWLGLRSPWRPSLEEIYRDIAKVFIDIRKYDEAITYLKEGIEKIPSSKYLKSDLTSSYEMRAKIYEQRGDYNSALKDYQSIITMERDEFVEYGTRIKMAEIYIKRGMKEEAIEEYSKALEIVKENKWESWINELELRLKDLQQ